MAHDRNDSPAAGSRRFQPKHLVAIVGMICAAAVLTPVTANAAGQLVTLTDSVNNARQARVSSNGALAVENRPPVNGFSSNGSASAGARALVHSTTSPTRFAVSEVSTSATSGASTLTLSVYTRTSGTGTCSGITQNTTGFSQQVMRRWNVPAGQTVQLSFPTGLLSVMQGASGAPACLTLHTSGGVIYGVTGYRFV